nr:DUF86 domain-containing protein [Candidatus Njordarchaeota archaeon]
MYDRTGIIDHINELGESMRDWERYKRTVTLEELMNDRDKRNMVLHAMLVTIQACIDIANHIIAERKLRRPATYSEAFDILVEEKFIPTKLGQSLSDLARFRNIITHVYWRLDLRRVHDTLKKDLSYLQEYLKIMKERLTRQEE